MRFSTLLAAMVVLACVVSSCSSGGGNAGAADDVTIRLPDIQADGTGSSNDLLSDVHRLPPDGGGEAVDGGGDGETAWPPPDVTEDDGASTDLSDATDLPDDVPDTTPLPDAGPDTPWLPDIIPDTAIPQDLPVEEVAEEIAEEDVAPGCGDGECSPAEDCATCPGDCPCPGGYSCVLGSCQYAGICPNVPAPEPVDLDPLPAMVPAGKVEKTTANGFTDDYLYDGTDLLKIGTRREWGSTVIFFGMGGGSPGMNTTNVIDAHDTGREVQVAFYDPDRILQGCAHNATCQTQPGSSCPGSITYLGWNPVQGGNECNIGSGTEWVDAQPGLLEAGVQPKFWNPDWQLADCSNGGCSDPAKKNLVSDVFYTQRLRFVSTHVVEMKMTVENLSDIDHAPTHQEFPTLYATYGYQNTPNLKVLLDSQGNTIPIDIPANDGFFHKIFDSPGGWAALQNTNLDYGVGLYYENRITGFQGWQKAGVFNNFRSLFSFGIPGKGTVNARAYIVLGSYETIAGLIADLDGSLPPFGVLDSPAADAPVDGTVNVSGWVLDNKGVSKLTLLVDGVQAGQLAIDKERPDVCAAWPGYAMCNMVGFNQNVSLAGATPCHHLLEVEATDTDGNARVIARRRIVVDAPASCQSDGECDDGDPCSVDACVAWVCSHTPVAPGQGPAESCNGVDDDCDGTVDEEGAAGCQDWYADGDKDGWGSGAGKCLCSATGQFVTTKGGDCKDGDGSVHPGAAEVCNGKDDNCDGSVDPGDTCAQTTHPVYRFVWSSGGDSDHMFGLSPSAPPGYQLEGTAFNLYGNPGAGLVPLYQLYCPACTDHLQGTSPTEGTPSYGQAEILGYASLTQSAATPTKAHRLYSNSATDHFITTDPNEWQNAQGMGYALEQAFWLP